MASNRNSLAALSMLVAVAFVVRACADRSRSTAVQPQPTIYEALPPPELGDGSQDLSVSSQGLGVNEGGTYPYGQAGASGQPVEGDSGSQAQGLVVVQAPDGSLWRANSEDAAQRQRDISACHQFANALARHDEQIYDDSQALRDTLSNNSYFSVVQKQREEYDLFRVRGQAMNDCMRKHGYSQFD